MNLFMARLSVTSLLWTPIAAESFADVPKVYRNAILVTGAMDARGNVFEINVTLKRKTRQTNIFGGDE